MGFLGNLFHHYGHRNMGQLSLRQMPSKPGENVDVPNCDLISVAAKAAVSYIVSDQCRRRMERWVRNL
jgi:hypothetical protein